MSGESANFHCGTRWDLGRTNTAAPNHKAEDSRISQHRGGETMRVTINHEQRNSGLILKKTRIAVVLSVQFSEEELATIKTRKLKNTVVLERKWDATMREKAAAHPEYYDTVPPPSAALAGARVAWGRDA
jgi:hypothetical protein